MIERLRAAYMDYWWAKVIACAGLCIAGLLLYGLFGGFPPWAWRFLLQVLPQFPRLWETQGSAILLPFIGLLSFSMALFLLWSLLILALFQIFLHWRRGWRQQQRLALELQEAERLAEYHLAITEPIEKVESKIESVEQPHITHAIESQLANGTMGATWTAPLSTFSTPHQPSARDTQIPSRTDSIRNQLRIVPRSDEVNEINHDEIDTDRKDALSATEDSIDQIDTLPGDTPLAIEDDTDQTERLPKLVLEDATDQTDRLPRLEDAILEKEVYESNGSLRLVASIGLDPGLLRKDAPNEDTPFALQGLRMSDKGPQPVGLFVIADGMGGHANGQEASRLAVRSISDAVVPAMVSCADEDEVISDLLKDGVHRANLAIYRRNRNQQHMMGTTLTAALIVNETAYVANVGDSRTYCYRPSSGLSQITRDHSLVARLVEDGIITRDEIYTHPDRNQIYRCVGMHASIEIDTFVVPLSAGDTLLLCSDGLWEMVYDDEIEQIIEDSAAHASQISTQLIQAALDNGGADNVSVVVIYVEEDDSTENYEN